MKIYLTSAKANQEKMLWLRGWLELQGHSVTSTWFDSDLAKLLLCPSVEAPISLIEIDECDAVLVYVAPDHAVSSNVGFEAGFAYRSGKKLFYLGEAPDMFSARYGKPWPVAVEAEVAA